MDMFENSVNQSVSNNKQLESNADKIASKIKTILQDKNTKDIASKLLNEGNVEKLFADFEVQDDLLEYINFVSNLVKEISEVVNKQIPHLKIIFKKEYLLNERKKTRSINKRRNLKVELVLKLIENLEAFINNSKHNFSEADEVMKVLISENIANDEYPYLLQNIPIFEKIKCDPNVKENLLKVKGLLLKIGKTSSVLCKDNSKARMKGEEMQNKFLDRLVDNISSKLDTLTSANDPEFRENFDKEYQKTNEKINKKIGKLENDDVEYLDITSWIFGDENDQDRFEYSKASKMLREDIKNNPNGNLLHLTLISHAFSSPIQMIKDNKLYENIGENFKGNPIIVMYNALSPFE